MTEMHTDILTDAQRAYVDGLRQLADFLEQRPDLDYIFATVQVDLFAYSVEDFKALSCRVGGHRAKEVQGKYFCHIRLFGPHSVRINAPQDRICERRVIGTREHPAKLIEAYTEEIVEWVCPPTFAAEAGVLQ